MSGVIIGAALCCLPGATLGSIYDDWQASKEAPEMERRARQHQAELQTQRRCVAGSSCRAARCLYQLLSREAPFGCVFMRSFAC